MKEMETGSQLNPNLLNLRWKARGRKQNASSQNGVEVQHRGSGLE